MREPLRGIVACLYLRPYYEAVMGIQLLVRPWLNALGTSEQLGVYHRG